MSKLLTLSILAGVVLAPSAAVAAPARISGTNVPARFCEGVRFDDQKYGPFIDANALDLKAAALMNDPVVREAARRARAEKWSGQVRAGQVAKCGRSTF
ncbi:MAG TPA: hypothetical protein VD866_19015 [Urbifossiella sp.]|nr:hypothetical protein [Urbifossiella sp.]